MIVSTEHFSFTVSDMNEALHFFCDLLGLKATPVTDIEGEDLSNIVGMRGAHLRVSMVQLPDKGSIELIQYLAPKGAVIDLATCNIGVAHIAFAVSNLQQMYEDLNGKGATFVSPPVSMPGPDGSGKSAICYLRGPDNITFEFIEKQR